jgi:hypothetical protein
VTAVITLTTDFGTRDPYVAEMKTVILAMHPAVRLVDVTHQVAAHDVIEGALAVEAMAAVCPPRTIHLAVVDPGVGTSRRGLAVAAAEQLFVGPDNGIFTPVLGASGWQAFELRAAEYRRATVSPTFHGRDVFAPAAAHLALGVAPERFGPPVTDPVRLDWTMARSADGVLDGQVVHVDRFGNLVTSIGAHRLDRLIGGGTAGVTVRIAGRAIPLVRTFGDLPPGGVGALMGSHGRLEVVVREGNAAARLRARRGTAVRVSRSRTRTSSRAASSPAASSPARRRSRS